MNVTLEPGQLQHWTLFVPPGQGIRVEVDSSQLVTIHLLHPDAFTLWNEGGELRPEWSSKESGVWVLHATLRPSYPGTWMIVVVNDSSKDAYVNAEIRVTR